MPSASISSSPISWCGVCRQLLVDRAAGGEGSDIHVMLSSQNPSCMALKMRAALSLSEARVEPYWPRIPSAQLSVA